MASECEAWEIAVIEKRQDRHQLFFGHCWLPELRFSLLFSTARPSSTREKLVLYRIIRAKEVEGKALDLVVDGLLKNHKPGESSQR